MERRPALSPHMSATIGNLLGRAAVNSRTILSSVRQRFRPSGYRLNGEHVVWPLAELYTGGNPIARKLVVVKGPLRTDRQSETLQRYLRHGYRIVGVSSYQEFPGRVLNPHEEARVYEFSFFDAYRQACTGWLHCFREPEACLPDDLPRIFMANSDFTDYTRIGPGRVDAVALPCDKSYDFIYVCGPGRWNAFCRNLPLAERCINLLAESGFRVLVVGREETREWAESPGVTVKPYLRWYDFLGHLSQCRFLFLPNIHDASPRILAEALCLDIPILVNRGILGGWHYVNPRTGSFFSDEGDFMQGVEALLRGRFTPRQYFVRNHGPLRSGRRLRRFLLEVSKRNAVPRLPAAKRETAAVDIGTLEVCRKITINPCSDPPRVAFLVLTHAANHRTRCRAQYGTWGGRTGKIVYFSNGADDVIPVVSLRFDGPESYDNLAHKMAAVLRYAWLRLARRYDWFMIADDDSYVILDNLYAYLSSEWIRQEDAAGTPLYLGRRFKRPGDDFAYCSGGAGCVLNKPALEAFVESRNEIETPVGFPADVLVGMTLARSGIHPLDTRDEAGAERFHPFTPRVHYEYRSRHAPEDDWLKSYTREFELIEGIDGIATQSVSFHSVDPRLMHAMDELLHP